MRYYPPSLPYPPSPLPFSSAACQPSASRVKLDACARRTVPFLPTFVGYFPDIGVFLACGGGYSLPSILHPLSTHHSFPFRPPRPSHPVPR